VKAGVTVEERVERRAAATADRMVGRTAEAKVGVKDGATVEQ
jgi:hypothetical protein